MLFVTFQPIGYENMSRGENWHDKYYNYIGYNPVYAINAETLLNAIIGTCITLPTYPEQAIFFRCNDYYAINVIDHFKALAHDSDYKPLTQKEIQALAGNDVKDLSDISLNGAKDLSNISLMGPYEFLVKKEDMDIIEVVDIGNRIRNDINKNMLEYMNASAYYQLISKTPAMKKNREYIDKILKNRISNVTHAERIIDSRFWWMAYAFEHDLFIKDYKKVIGCKNGEQDLSMKNADPLKGVLFRRKCEFDMNPCQETYALFRDYFIENLIKR